MKLKPRTQFGESKMAILELLAIGFEVIYIDGNKGDLKVITLYKDVRKDEEYMKNNPGYSYYSSWIVELIDRSGYLPNMKLYTISQFRDECEIILETKVVKSIDKYIHSRK